MFNTTQSQPTQSDRPFIPSRQQLSVRDWVIDKTGSLLLRARAGCGKSSTLVYLLQFLQGLVFLGAFNKAIADELNAKVGYRQGVKIGTWHALGMSYVRQITQNIQPADKRKVNTIAKEFFPSNNEIDKKCRKIICEAVSFAKQTGFGLGADLGFAPIESTRDWLSLCEYYELFDELPPVIITSGSVPDNHNPIKEIVEIFKKVYRISIDKVKSDGWIDFDDMIFAPLYYRVITPKYNWVLIDEAQDTNGVRREMAKRVLKHGGRIVFVGDDYQAIYGFAGATNDALDVMKAELKAAELPLSVTYRCGKSIVDVANTWCSDITAHQDNTDGLVREMNHREFLQFPFDQSDVILCRNTRPLIGIAKWLRSRGIQCVVEGVNYGGLIGLASRWGEEISIADMLEGLHEYTAEKCKEYQDNEDEEKVERQQEKFDMIRDFSQGLNPHDPVYKLLDEMDRILSSVEEDRRILRLCTIHRSKGREWGRVFLVGRNQYQPSKWAKAEWEMKQEKNLMYVAVTRAKVELVEVVVPPKIVGKPQWWEAMYANDDMEYDPGELTEEEQAEWEVLKSEAGQE